MKKLQEKLPYTDGNGGDFNLIEWLVENAVTAIYTTLVVSSLTVPTKKILTSAKQSLKVRKRIRTYIRTFIILMIVKKSLLKILFIKKLSMSKKN